MLVIPPVPIVSGNLIRDLVNKVFTRHCEESTESADDAAIPYTHEIVPILFPTLSEYSNVDPAPRGFILSFVSRNDDCQNVLQVHDSRVINEFLREEIGCYPEII